MTDGRRPSWEQKKDRLLRRMEELAETDICLAFSGGADSSLLLYLARDMAESRGTRVYALTFDTTLHPRTDMEAAGATAAEAGVAHRVIPVDELAELPEIQTNPPDRCYLCKKHLFVNLKEMAIRAIRELGIISPLAETGFSKAEVRRFAGELGIRAAERPSSPCMATRLPYGASLDAAVLKRLEQAESALRALGFRQVRARLHGEILRLEVEPEEILRAAREAEKILQTLQALKFRYITLDLEGFRSGSMDRAITPSVS